MKFSQFLREAHSENGVASSKRLYGGIMIVTVQICLLIAVILAFIHGFDLSAILKELLEVDLFTGAGLLGLNSVTKIFENRGYTTNTTNTTNNTTNITTRVDE